mmetsp:Transcript_19902/g.38655  ORF Transcript_19902/g.38655 Transcript_19902/m.38655 type:complete len:89 (-) Transcript_19902:511-777(-)
MKYVCAYPDLGAEKHERSRVDRGRVETARHELGDFKCSHEARPRRGHPPRASGALQSRGCSCARRAVKLSSALDSVVLPAAGVSLPPS